eukprot:4070351-Alexandrium_andersonii.AAC.1
MTETDLMKKYNNDTEYVNMVKERCIANKLAQRDELAPKDDTKIRYWICDDQNMKFQNIQEAEFCLNGKIGVEHDQALQLTGPDGIFNGALQMEMPGFNNTEMNRIGDGFFAAGSSSGRASKAKGKGKAK